MKNIATTRLLLYSHCHKKSITICTVLHMLFYPLFISLFIGCTQFPKLPVKLPHSVYLWQRHWTPELMETIAQNDSFFQSMHVLTFQAEPSGRIIKINYDADFLCTLNQSLTAVIRLSDNISDVVWDSLSQCAALLRSPGQPVWDGIEIDYDCPTSKLADYAHHLKKIRTLIPGSYALSITTLPSWTESTDLSPLLTIVDETILQVHSVSPLTGGLFNKASALDYITAYARHSEKPFVVALPCYSSRVFTGASGGVVGVESEVPRNDLHGLNSKEIRANPIDVAALLQTKKLTRIRNLSGYIWFRLPLASDTRSWNILTLRAVIRHELLVAHVQLNFNTHNGNTDIALVNTGTTSAPLPIIEVIGKPVFIEPLNMYTITIHDNKAYLQPPRDGQIGAGATLPVGWVRGDTSIKVTMVCNEDTKASPTLSLKDIQ